MEPSSKKSSAGSPPRRGELYAFMAAEHVQLDQLLAQAGAADNQAYEQLRERLLRHIRVEEKILFPMVARKLGAPLPIAKRLQLDHGALAALVTLAPGEGTLRAIRAVLAAHNPLEEMVGGVYEQCESLAAEELDELMAQIRAAPAVRVSSWIDSPKVFQAAQRALARAGYDPKLLESAPARPR